MSAQIKKFWYKNAKFCRTLRTFTFLPFQNFLFCPSAKFWCCSASTFTMMNFSPAWVWYFLQHSSQSTWPYAAVPYGFSNSLNLHGSLASSWQHLPVPTDVPCTLSRPVRQRFPEERNVRSKTDLKLIDYEFTQGFHCIFQVQSRHQVYNRIH